eukprot:7471418-Pyramimonas_sp.AAC.1
MQTHHRPPCSFNRDVSACPRSAGVFQPILGSANRRAQPLTLRAAHDQDVRSSPFGIMNSPEGGWGELTTRHYSRGWSVISSARY